MVFLIWFRISTPFPWSPAWCYIPGILALRRWARRRKVRSSMPASASSEFEAILGYLRSCFGQTSKQTNETYKDYREILRILEKFFPSKVHDLSYATYTKFSKEFQEPLRESVWDLVKLRTFSLNRHFIPQSWDTLKWPWIKPWYWSLSLLKCITSYVCNPPSFL